MNMPKRASCHHFMRASRSASPGCGAGDAPGRNCCSADASRAAATAAPAAIQLRQSRLVMGYAPEGTEYHAVRPPGVSFKHAVLVAAVFGWAGIRAGDRAQAEGRELRSTREYAHRGHRRRVYGA